VYRILDQVLATGEPVHVERKGRLLLISPAEGMTEPDPECRRRLEDFAISPTLLVGDPDDIVEIDWSRYWDPDRALDP